MPTPESYQEIFKHYGRLLVSGLATMACIGCIGYLARWIPTWMALGAVVVSCIVIGVTLGKRLGWPIGWALTIALTFGIGGAFTGSEERKQAAANELGPVPLSVVIEREGHEAFYLKDVRLGDVEYEFTHCGEEDCYDDVLVSLQDNASGPEVPIKHWIQASQDKSFNQAYIFSRISLTYHTPSELQKACRASGRSCVSDEEASFFEPIEPHALKQAAREQHQGQEKGDDDWFVFLILVTALWVVPVLFGTARACWRRSLGKA